MSLNTHNVTVVGCSVSDARARSRLRRAVVHEGAGFSELPSPLRKGLIGSLDGCCALVIDLAPWVDSAIATLHWVRRVRPIMPVLLFTPNVSRVAMLLLECGRMEGVRAFSQPQSVDDPHALRNEIRTLLDGIGGLAFLEIVKRAVPGAPRVVLGYVRWAVRLLCDERHLASLTVGLVSSRLDVSERSLHRLWGSAALPHPKEMLDWLLLLFVSFQAERTGLPQSTVAGHIRLNRQRLYRIRRRLIQNEFKSNSSNAAQEFDLVLLAFLQRCGVPRREAEEIGHRLLA